MNRISPLPLAAALATAFTTAHADQRQLDSLAGDLVDVAPLPGRDRVAPRTPPWCAGVKLEGSWGPNSIARNIAAAERDWKNLLVAARVACQWAEHPAVKRATAIIAQTWINLTGLPEAAAFESLTLRLDDGRFVPDKKRLCAQFEVSGEIAGGETKTFMEARAVLLGCGPNQPMWLDARSIPDTTLEYVDAATELDPAVQLALVLSATNRAFEGPSTAFDRDLLTVAAIQPDTATIAKAKLPELADQPLYKGNTYARAVLLESLYRAKLAIAEIEKNIAGRDADWKQLLVTAPAPAFADWTASAAKHRDALARSNEFEHKFWGASRKDVKGCWPVLRADFIAVLKALPHANPTELAQAMSAPVPSLLYSRLAACAAIDHPDQQYVRLVVALGDKLRPSRGPRTAAYHAILESFAAIVTDRPRFPVQTSTLRSAPGGTLLRAAADATRAGQGFVGGDGTGTVKTIKQVAGGVQVTFVTTKEQIANIVCVDTKKLWRIADNGTFVYYQSCKQAGLRWIDRTPDAVTIPSEWATNIKPGAVVEFVAMVGKAPGRIALPTSVYANKSAKTLAGFMGFGL